MKILICAILSLIMTNFRFFAQEIPCQFFVEQKIDSILHQRLYNRSNPEVRDSTYAFIFMSTDSFGSITKCQIRRSNLNKRTKKILENELRKCKFPCIPKEFGMFEYGVTVPYKPSKSKFIQ
jgi:hypothetical protein